MFRFTCRSTRCCVFLFFASVGHVAGGETWTDSSGEFTIEAKFVGVEGSSIVLLKDNGLKATVPIARLSAESRSKAKAQYQAMLSAMSDSGSETTESSGQLVREKRALAFTPPVPPKIAPLEKFPENMSLQETLDFTKKQLLAGHPEVFWYALPAEVREALDSPELRQGVSPFVEKNAATASQVETVIFKAIEVLVTKKRFVLGSAMMQQVPPPIVASVQQGYDPAVGLIYELADTGFSIKSIGDNSVSSMIDYHAPRIGAHAQALLPLAPPGMIEGFLDSIEVEMIDENNGILKKPEVVEAFSQEGSDSSGIEDSDAPEDLRMTRFKGRWVPSDLAENWDEIQSRLGGDISAQIAAVEEKNAKQTQGMMMMMGAVTGMVGTVLDSLLAADTQEAFDAALMQAQAMSNMGGSALGGMGAPAKGNDEGESGFGFE